MNQYDLEQELRHLEFVFSRILATDRVPTLAYWRSRLNALRKLVTVLSQRDRVNRLEQALRALEQSLSARKGGRLKEEEKEFSQASDFWPG